jgi:hypothetical protein|tara:strand:+ start:864 stop:1052 length:189 start_codon:yes stop_codon:yes gene_type:complete
MKNQKWNAIRLTIIGAVAGAMFTLFSGDMGNHPSELAGSLLGGAAAGAFMLGIVAVVRNLLT